MNVGYIAITADGYIADSNGDVSFLDQYQHIDCGYDDFIQRIDAIIIGKKSYEAILAFGVDWPYSTQKTWIITQDKNLPKPHESIELWHSDLASLTTHIAQRNLANTWILGGGQLISSAINEGLMDQLHIFTMPILLGNGIPLFPKNIFNHTNITKTSSQLIDDTVIHQIYDFT